MIHTKGMTGLRVKPPKDFRPQFFGFKKDLKINQFSYKYIT